MDQETMTLASTAATTMVALLATDSWTQVKKEIGSLWRRFKPEHAAAVEADLSEAHAEAISAVETGDEQVTQALETEWASRLKRLLVADVAARTELSRVTAILARELEQTFAEGGQQGGKVTITQKADASDHSAVIQVAGDAAIGKLALGSAAGPRN